MSPNQLIDLATYCPQPVKRERGTFSSKLSGKLPGRFTRNKIQVFRIENPGAQFGSERIRSTRKGSLLPGSKAFPIEISSSATP